MATTYFADLEDRRRLATAELHMYLAHLAHEALELGAAPHLDPEDVQSIAARWTTSHLSAECCHDEDGVCSAHLDFDILTMMLVGRLEALMEQGGTD